MTCDSSVVFSGFFDQWTLPPRYNWNIVDSGAKHHNPNPERLYEMIREWDNRATDIFSVTGLESGLVKPDLSSVAATVRNQLKMSLTTCHFQNALPSMVHGHHYHIITRQSPSRWLSLSVCRNHTKMTYVQRRCSLSRFPVFRTWIFSVNRISIELTTSFPISERK